MRTPLLLLVLLLLGCPKPLVSVPPSALVLGVDVEDSAPQPFQVKVGDSEQLRLSWSSAAGSTEHLVGALVQRRTPTIWGIAPTGAAEVDSNSLQVTFLQRGEVTISATYDYQGNPMRSNTLHFQVAEATDGEQNSKQSE